MPVIRFTGLGKVLEYTVQTHIGVWVKKQNVHFDFISITNYITFYVETQAFESDCYEMHMVIKDVLIVEHKDPHKYTSKLHVFSPSSWKPICGHQKKGQSC